MSLREPTPIHERPRIAWGLAEALTAGAWRADELTLRASDVLGGWTHGVEALAHRLEQAFGLGPRPLTGTVANWIEADPGFQSACERNWLTLHLVASLPPVMHPAPGRPTEWAVPAIVTLKALAEFLELSFGELEWFVDIQGRGRTRAAGPLQHYRYHWQAKRSGSARLIEAPKTRLKALQRLVLERIVSRISPHEAAHGFRSGRSIHTYVAPHVGRPVVVALDLKDFFATIGRPRVAGVFRTAGFPEPVARALAALCTNQTPPSIWESPSSPLHGAEVWRSRRMYASAHLPQGAPTSPALANLCAYRLDLRLAALAETAGACYTRYADDLTFSGGRDFERSIRRFPIHVFAAALEEGFTIQPRKTRVMRQSVRQRVAGVVLNERPNVVRADYDRLKAILHNCVHLGPATQNRAGLNDFQAHLRGLVAHVSTIHEARGRRLKALLDRIDWR
jgi:hypothetical protein